MAAMETRLLLEGGRVSDAVETCLDTLALSRELALGDGFEGQGASAEGYDLAWRPCAAALDAAPVDLKHRAAMRIVRLAEGIPPFSLTLKEESVAQQLSYFRDVLSEEQQTALPPVTRPVPLPTSTTVEDASPGRWDWMYSRLMWRRLCRMYEQFAATADLPAHERQRAFATLEAKLGADEGWLPLPVRGTLPALSATVILLAEALDVRRLQSDALIALAEVDVKRAEQGRWPKTPPREASSLVLEFDGPGEAVLKPCAASLSRYALRITADTPGNLQTRAP
jgi:hypothetical protein